MKTYFIPHDSPIVILPTPEQVSIYLEQSKLWKPYVNHVNSDFTGFECTRKDDVGKTILILEHKLYRDEHNPFYEDQFFSIISLMAAVEGLEDEEMVNKIKNS